MPQRLSLIFLLTLVVSLALPPAVFADDIIHTVQPGENLFRIGLKYGIGWKEIMAANGLSSTYITVGQQLRIPAGGGGETAASAAPAAPETPAVTSPGMYTIARGDTLRSIASKFGITTTALAAANGLSDPNRIYYGQALAIPGANGEPAPAVSIPAPTGGNKRIVVDISEQRMYAYEGGALVWSWVASTGERGRDTAPGNYSVLNKIPNAYASLWNLQMPNWLGIYWVGKFQNGIHALPILSNGQQLWAGWLGTPVSYGCVILGTEEAAALFAWAELGTPVTIQW
ncbi:MAG: LysM peptidoglycan-binding domain-containing protein [Chloroflexota bacterium]